MLPSHPPLQMGLNYLKEGLCCNTKQNMITNSEPEISAYTDFNQLDLAKLNILYNSLYMDSKIDDLFVRNREIIKMRDLYKYQYQNYILSYLNHKRADLCSKRCQSSQLLDYNIKEDSGEKVVDTESTSINDCMKASQMYLIDNLLNKGNGEYLDASKEVKNKKASLVNELYMYNLMCCNQSYDIEKYNLNTLTTTKNKRTESALIENAITAIHNETTINEYIDHFVPNNYIENVALAKETLTNIKSIDNSFNSLKGFDKNDITKDSMNVIVTTNNDSNFLNMNSFNYLTYNMLNPYLCQIAKECNINNCGINLTGCPRKFKCKNKTFGDDAKENDIPTTPIIRANNLSIQSNSPLLKLPNQNNDTPNNLSLYRSIENAKKFYSNRLHQANNNKRCHRNGNINKHNIRRQRTIFSGDQTSKLECEFKKCEYVSREQRQSLARNLYLSESQVKIWFQNRRAKDKRIEKANVCISPNVKKDMENPEMQGYCLIKACPPIGIKFGQKCTKKCSSYR
ncbi:unnamed protein product [Gordionus sp. m RMFG-2023]